MRLSEAIKVLQEALERCGDKELKQWRFSDGKIYNAPVTLEVAEASEFDTIGIILSCTE